MRCSALGSPLAFLHVIHGLTPKSEPETTALHQDATEQYYRARARITVQKTIWRDREIVLGVVRHPVDGLISPGGAAGGNRRTAAASLR
jgi:hypothetical protein